MANVIRYQIEGMRVNPPGDKTAERNPDLVFTVSGTAFHTLDDKGKVKESLSITSKPVTREQATNPDFGIDLTAGTLTLPEGRRGRQASAGIDQSAVDALLASLSGDAN